MKKAIGVVTIFIISIIGAKAQPPNYYNSQQRQNAEYKTQSDATKKAYNVTNTNNTTPANKTSSSSNSSGSSSKTPSTNSKTISNSGNNGYSNIGGGNKVEKQQEAGKRNDARMDEWNKKEARFNELSKGIERTSANFDRLVGLAEQAGFDNYSAKRMLGFINSPSSSTSSSSCQGDCKETLRSSKGGYSYTGNTKDGIPHGRGVFTYDSGDILTTDVVDGKPNGKAIMQWKIGAVYEGDIRNGELTGTGSITTPEGQKYYGSFENGVLIEEAKESRSNISKSSGTKINGKFSGDDIYIEWKTGEKFTGTAVNGNLIKGKIEYTDGSFYEGEMTDINHRTKGKLTYNDGETFEGTFNGTKKKFGTHTYKDGSRFTAQYTPDGKMAICGIYKDGGTISEGFYIENSIQNGYGKWKTKDKFYEGEFVKGNQQGLGSLSFEGKTITGKVVYQGFLVYGMTKVNGKLTAATLNKDWKIVYLPKEQEADALKAYTDALHYIEINSPLYENCMKGNAADQVQNKKTTSLPSNNTNKGNFLFTDWNSAKNYEWEWLETPKTDPNIYRFINNNLLVYVQQSVSYVWTFANLKSYILNNWTYSANMGIVKMEHEQTASGILLQAKNSGDTKNTNIMFMVNPGDQKYWFGTYNENNNEWKTLNYFEGTNYNIYSNAIKKFIEGKGSENLLSIKKSANTIILSVNDQVLETIQINESNSILNQVFGIGLSTYQKGQGGVDKIIFSTTK